MKIGINRKCFAASHKGKELWRFNGHGPALMSGRITDLEVCNKQQDHLHRYSWRYGKSNDGGASFIQYLMNIFNLLAVLQLILLKDQKHLGWY
jgi:hypothetical protein